MIRVAQIRSLHTVETQAMVELYRFSQWMTRLKIRLVSRWINSVAQMETFNTIGPTQSYYHLLNI